MGLSVDLSYTLIMVGPTAQLSCLAMHINARIRGIPTATFNNSTTQFCECVKFLHKSDPPRPGDPDPNWHIVSESPDDWMLSLRKVRRALIAHEATNDPRLSDRMSSGFVGGGGRWFLCLDKGKFDCWEGWWRVGNQKAADRRIWQVHYARVVEGHDMETEQLAAITAPVSDIGHSLNVALERIEVFARAHDQTGFADCFQKAIDALNPDRKPAEAFHTDLAPAGALPPAAARLMTACQHAWVFGGMGSWNDMGFAGEVQREYESVSDDLFNQINQAICVAVNASVPKV